MALIRCADCGKQISDTASSCPNCGMVITDEKKYEGYKMMQKEKNRVGIGILSCVFGLLLPIVGLILGIAGCVKGERYSVYGIFISILAAIGWFMILSYMGVAQETSPYFAW